MGTYDWAAQAYHDSAPFAAFDLETTGLDPRQDRIVEIGAVKFDRRGLLGRFSVLINPGIPMPAEASRVNGITDALLRGKPRLDQVFPDFLRFIRGTVLVAHNAPFDAGFINEKLRAGSDPPLTDRLVDTLVYAREVFPGRNSYKLRNLAVSLGIAAGEVHRAEEDARLCMEIFIRCLAP
ncbi:MAG: 3'-5' exonuclease [Treponema sp.]|jgi:DNA polymerase-3 subunit epsilon|nr:3'-5' exonuclease [Treponema sp.]